MTDPDHWDGIDVILSMLLIGVALLVFWGIVAYLIVVVT